MKRRSRLPDFIIGGTEKAGTTSVFDWLASHPDVGVSLRKETDFFRRQFTGDLALDARRYAACFDPREAQAQVLMEASPGYLGEARVVAPRMAELVPSVKLLFILRDPVVRFQSSYEFHRGRLNLPRDLSLADYLRRCLAFDRGEATPAGLGLDEWFLKVLRFGCYAEFIDVYRSELPDAGIKIMFFEDLRENPSVFMRELSAFLAIDTAHWDGFHFRASNTTFAGRNEWLHRLALRTNSALEPLWRRAPIVKHSVLQLYKAVNQSSAGHGPMTADVREQLEAFYRPSLQILRRQLGRDLPEAWQRRDAGRIAA
jgi:hypothetical protein